MLNENSSIAVIYKSKYGSTRKYAGWIAIKLDADLYEISDVRKNDLIKYDVIIYGGPLCAGKIKGIDLINKNYKMIEDKNIIVFAVGLSSKFQESKNTILTSNFKEDIREKINLFYLRGAFNYKELGVADKVLMNVMKITLKAKKEEELDQDSKEMLEAFEKPVDFSNKKLVNPIVDFVCKDIKIKY